MTPSQQLRNKVAAAIDKVCDASPAGSAMKVLKAHQRGAIADASWAAIEEDVRKREATMRHGLEQARLYAFAHGQTIDAVEEALRPFMEGKDG